MTRKQLLGLALDLWEIASDYGTEPVSPSAWCTRHKREGATYAATYRRWDRLKARIRQSPFPVEWVRCEALGSCGPKGGDTPKGIAMNALGIRMHQGALRQLTLILNNEAGIETGPEQYSHI